MNRTLIRGEDGSLIDALAGALGGLRGHSYGPFPADGFPEKLGGHLRFAEETLFPALRALGLSSAGDLGELEEDHRLLGVYARDLAAQLREQHRERACGIARSFLAVLLDHIRRETGGLEVSDVARLRAWIERSRPPAAGECPHE